MKSLLLIAVVVSTLTGCSMMPSRDSGSMSSQGSSQSMGSMSMGGGMMYGRNMQTWNGGDGPYFVRGNM
ncbi:hypothetical protein [Comamonas sp. 26]|uniref:hypothetical protein n=1 Tax=Comamonas sp. 26 TaxID=2035201 RepID=UPI000C176FC2|nr:hypothetical protein [Comamonas sp. 26]PIG09628.1 hypothetical protein CLU84_2558 [Comamonas sp. 26]